MNTNFGLNLSKYYSINFDLPKRDKKKIIFIILHYTGMRKESDAIKKLCDSKSKVSCHYFVKNNGEVLNLVPDLYQAWHAGQSSWQKIKSLNKYSIGIEINNPGHDHGYKKFSSKQIFSLLKLIRYLVKKYNIKKKNILGHSDISPNRKKDPGEKFPWKQLAKKNLCKWHSLNEKKIRKLRNFKLSNFEKNFFFNNLYDLGYSRIVDKKLKNEKINLVKAFQRKFRQELINGKIDKECLIISQNLIKF
ncbi:N-acetylmuramoyl-L-alanine amidase [Pelagibacterales bacterium SAG-MED39]|nr:N-acetylmuramoyl-L-alanine amidase [Pelagibacterales bacterium SAG-MED39]